MSGGRGRRLPYWRRVRVRLYMWPIMHLPLGALDQPIESFVAFLCIIAGTSQLTGLAEQQSVAASLPAAVVNLWSVELVVGGALVVTSVWRGDRRTERAGLLLLGIAATVYAICALAFLGTRSIYTACLTIAFALAVVLRAVIISVLIQLERALIDEDQRG